jgi:hypothetical protein
MKFIRFPKTVIATIVLAASTVFADPVDVETIARGGFWMRDNHLRDVGEMLLYSNGSFIDAGLNYTPFSTQLPLRSEFGEHEGFVARQHLSVMASYLLENQSILTALLWFERSGWDGEDFLFVPHYNDFGLIRSVTTWGFAYTSPSSLFSAAAGMQHQNVEYVGDVYPAENDSLLYAWANVRVGWFSAQASFHRTHLNMLRLSVDLEDRAVLGGASSGIKTYLPNFDLTMYKRKLDGFDEDFIRLTWEQNLFAQRLYGELTFDFPDDGFHSAAIKYYPDPSRFVGIEATCVRRRAVADNWDDLMFGWALELPILRIGYNSSYEYDHLFHAKGTWILEFHFNLGAIDNMLFAKGGRQAAPLETQQVKKKNTPNKSAETVPLTGDTGASEAPTKTITAKGVRYEKAAPANDSQGGN